MIWLVGSKTEMQFNVNSSTPLQKSCSVASETTADLRAGTGKRDAMACVTSLQGAGPVLSFHIADVRRTTESNARPPRRYNLRPGGLVGVRFKEAVIGSPRLGPWSADLKGGPQPESTGARPATSVARWSIQIRRRSVYLNYYIWSYQTRQVYLTAQVQLTIFLHTSMIYISI